MKNSNGYNPTFYLVLRFSKIELFVSLIVCNYTAQVFEDEKLGRLRDQVVVLPIRNRPTNPLHVRRWPVRSTSCVRRWPYQKYQLKNNGRGRRSLVRLTCHLLQFLHLLSENSPKTSIARRARPWGTVDTVLVLAATWYIYEVTSKEVQSNNSLYVDQRVLTRNLSQNEPIFKLQIRESSINENAS